MSKYINQIIGRRLIIKDSCDVDDFKNAGMEVPNCAEWKTKYVVGKCLNCGAIKPVNIYTLKRFPPKRCSYCSNIGHNSTINSTTNNYAEYDDYAVINIQFKNEVFTAYIDVEDVERCKTRYWRIAKKRNNLYVVSGKKGDQTYLHQFIIGRAPNGYEIDHIDHNPLNNRKSNLRYLSRSENAGRQKARIDGQIGIRGVSFDKKGKKYTVDFSHNNKRIYLKPWKTIEEACWCRYCLEDYYGLDLIKSNPLFADYDVLNDDKKKDIKNYTFSIIKNNKKLSV